MRTASWCACLHTRRSRWSCIHEIWAFGAADAQPIEAPRKRYGARCTYHLRPETDQLTRTYDLPPVTRTRGLQFKTQYFSPPAAAKSSIAFLCSSDNSSGTDTPTSTIKSPRVVSFWTP